MRPEEIADLGRMRRARDSLDRDYSQRLNVTVMARSANMSTAHFSRKFLEAYGETPYSYLLTRRIERAKWLLRRGTPVSETCELVGYTSLGSFSSRFAEVVGESPSCYRERDHTGFANVPNCVSKLRTRPLRWPVPPALGLAVSANRAGLEK